VEVVHAKEEDPRGQDDASVDSEVVDVGKPDEYLVEIVNVIRVLELAG
jgi:hypothetical protein